MGYVSMFSVCILILIGTSVSDDNHGENVIQYPEEAFADEIKKNPHFVMFYAPWCGHCKRLAPTFDQLALKHNTELKGKHITIAKVDCTEQTALCSTHGVTGYPTVKFFNGDDDPIKYSGPRTLEALNKFIDEKVKSSDEKSKDGSSSVEVTDGLYVLTDKTFSEVIAKGYTFVKFFAPWCGHCKRLAPTWDALAREYQNNKDINIAKVDCTQYSSLCQNNGVRGYPTLILFKNGEKVEQYQGSREQSALSGFLKSKSSVEGKEKDATHEKIPDKRETEEMQEKQADSDDASVEVTDGLYTLTEKTFNDIIAKGHTFVKFFAPWCGHCKKLAPTWDALAKEYQHNKDINIVKIDCTKYKSVCEQYQVRGYPTLIFFKDGVKVDEYHGSRDQHSLSAFIRSKSGLNDSRKEQEAQTEEEEKGLDDGVVKGLSILTSENFKNTLHEEHALVMFYAPWCPHCKSLGPVWNKLAAEYIGHDNVVIGKVDCTEHRQLCSNNEVKGYPTLHYFHDGKRIEKYTGGRDLQSLIRFMDKKLLTVTVEQREALKAADGSVIHLDRKTFAKEISKGFTFVKFFAPWCGHCKALAPTWAKLSESFSANANIKIAKVDCTLEEALCESQNIEGFPTLYLFRNGKKISEHEGERDLDTLRKFILDQVPHDEL